MKICLVLLALLVAMACGHNKDGGSYSAKKADKLSFKESLIEKIHNIKDKIHAKISSKKATKAAIKAQKHSGLLANLDRGAQPAADCSTVLDDVWEEHCGTKYEPVCRMEMQPHCTSIQAKECAPEAQTRCSFVFEDKCKTISVPKCTIDWEKRCTSTPDCTTIEAKSCTEVEKDVCVTHMDKTCTMSTLNVCRKVAVRELTPVVDTVERTGLKASIKAAHKAHKAGLKASLKAKIAAHKAQKKGYTPVDDTVERIGLKASIKAKAAAHKAHKAGLKASIKAKAAAHKAHKAGLKASIKAKVAAHKAQKKGQLVNSQDLSARTEDISVQGHDFNTGPFGDITPEDYRDAIQACDTDGSGTCDLHEQLRRRREANHAYGQLPGDAARLAEDAGPEENKSIFDFIGRVPIQSGNDALQNIDEDGDGQISIDEGIGRRRRAANHAYGRTSQSLKGDTSDDLTTYLAAKSFHASKGDKGQITAKKADFKGRLETFKAGYKAAKDQYHEAKAQFKATTKALIHAKFNKGPKASKGDKGHHVKAAVPTITVRYVKTCQDEPRKICSQTPRQECHKEVVPLCKVEPRETCVPKEKCKSWPKKNCGMVHKETCLPFPTKKCIETSKPVCRIVPRQECTEKKHEICETVPTKDCQKVLVSKPRTVCIPKPTTRTIEDW